MPWNPFKRSLDGERIRQVVDRVSALSAEGNGAEAYEAARPLLSAAAEQGEAAVALVALLDDGCLGVDRALEVIAVIFEHHAGDRALLADLGTASASARDWRYLNAAPPTDDVLERLAEALEAAVTAPPDESTPRLHYGLATLCRVLGRRWDDLAERSYQAAIAAEPDRWQLHYDLGLFYKTRGRFAEGMAANQRAQSLGGENDESVRWNLGICATGARESDVALRVWKELGQHIETGRFGLPEGKYPSTKVCLAEHPLAERRAEQDAAGPGLEETIWIERLSPCHGIVRSVLFGNLGVDYGDVVLFDGAPITSHTYGDSSVSVFPHMATLEHRGYRRFDFAGTQSRQNEIADLTDRLPMDAVVYSHTEQVVRLCKRCWEERETGHPHDRDAEHHVVLGRIAAPPELSAPDLQAALDAALKDTSTLRLMVPALAQAAGDPGRAEVERRRYEMVLSNRRE